MAAIKGERTLIELAQDFDGRDLSGSRFDEGEKNDLPDGLDLAFDMPRTSCAAGARGYVPIQI
ncbi:hypothetical protein [Sulfitobacter guttiformis]|uniref:hypothetical protein n=1 Tax=Sulfitobacter guttiformis TaxID=74349 RepID=UPI00046AF20D|nr:hypothetical protein [Sulfitobacter guttiformis]